MEVKTVVIGEGEQTAGENEQARGRTCKHSSFSRVAEATTFTQMATDELSRRGVHQAREVAAVQDGAEWVQGFVDGQRPDAVRILNFAHAASYVHAMGEAARSARIKLPAHWFEVVLHQLKHTGPPCVLKHLARLVARIGTAEAHATLAYLQKREDQMQYPRFRASGWPIGSGMVESANKLVVEARLKGAGMHWKPCHLNPMLALRNAVCNDRWDARPQADLRQSAASPPSPARHQGPATTSTTGVPPDRGAGALCGPSPGR